MLTAIHMYLSHNIRVKLFSDDMSMIVDAPYLVPINVASGPLYKSWSINGYQGRVNYGNPDGTVALCPGERDSICQNPKCS